MARCTWVCQRDMVVTRLAEGPADLTDPRIEEFECWVEIHGVPPESLDPEGIQMVMAKIGMPLTEVKSFYYGGQRVYKQRLKIDMNAPLIPKIPMKHPQLGLRWLYVVYENVANVCMFCARVGHDQSVCPAKLRLKLLQHDVKHKEKLGNTPIPDTMVGRWLVDRSFVPRMDESTQHQERVDDMSKQNTPTGANVTPDDGAGTSIARRSKRPIDLNIIQTRLLTTGLFQGEAEGEGEGNDNMRLNYKRAKEANPNSPSRCQ